MPSFCIDPRNFGTDESRSVFVESNVTFSWMALWDAVDVIDETR